MLSDDQLRELFHTIHTIAVVGLSENPDRPSHQVATYLKKQGYRVLPINPACINVLGERCYGNLAEAASDIAPTPIDVVDIFRRPEDVMPHIEEAISLGIKTIWMQEGIEHLDGARKAEGRGLKVVMNRCMKKEHQRLFAAANSKS